MSETSYLIFIIFFVGAIALRLRRELSFIRIGSIRFQLRLYLLPLISVLVSVVVAKHSLSLLAMTWLLSFLLVNYSLKTTAFENRPDGIWFRKNPWISTAVLLLLTAFNGLYYLAIKKKSGQIVS